MLFTQLIAIPLLLLTYFVFNMHTNVTEACIAMGFIFTFCIISTFRLYSKIENSSTEDYSKVKNEKNDVKTPNYSIETYGQIIAVVFVIAGCADAICKIIFQIFRYKFN